MILKFSPVFMDKGLTLHRKGDVLTINGHALDFGPLPEGASLPADAIASPWIAGPVTRAGGVLHVTVMLPHGANAPEATRFPMPLTLTVDGPVELPLYDTPTDEVAE